MYFVQDENELRNQWSERDPLEGDETAAQVILFKR